VLAALCAVTLAACIPIIRETPGPSATPTFNSQRAALGEASRSFLDYTIDLPAGWNDVTDDYLQHVPDSVLSGFWTMDSDLQSDGPYVTVSLHGVAAPDTDVMKAAEASAEGWRDDLKGASRGDSGYAETASGGVIIWASISGELDGELRTEHMAHVYYGPYAMYVEIDVPGGDEEDSHAILDALKTVTISGPVTTGERAGAPVPSAGTWSSYCHTIQASAQEGWAYQFTPGNDSFPWDCPEKTDYLGRWSVAHDGEQLTVEVGRMADIGLDARRDGLSIADSVGETETTTHGSEIKLLAEQPFDGPGAGKGVRIDLATLIPNSTSPYLSRSYLFEDSAGGVIEVYVDIQGGATIPDDGWLEPFVASITTPAAS